MAPSSHNTVQIQQAEPSMTSTTSTTVTTAKLKSGLVEAHQKVEASLLTSIEAHLQEHSSKAGLDFLHVKNTLFLSYLIDLVVYLKAKLTGSAPNKDNLQRLTEMKVVLDKTRGLDKKLRYQIDKLLQAENAATYATTGGSAEDESSANNNSSSDPLQYRPDPNAFGVDDDSSSSSGSDNDDDDDAGKINAGHEEEENDDDDDLESARRTIALAKESKEKKQRRQQQDEPTDTVYRAPRQTAVPYMLDKEDKEAQREKRKVRRMRTSELAHSLRQEYGEQPEQEDYHGGTEYGKQAQAAKRFAERQAEKTQYEEDAMMRLTVTRKEKKEHKRLMRLEGANLNGIADLSNLVQDASRVIGDKNDDSNNKRNSGAFGGTERHANGKRKKQQIDQEGRVIQSKSSDSRRKGKGGAKNSYQEALFGGSSGGNSKTKRSKR